MHDREAALRQRHAKEVEKLSQHTKILPQLRVGDHVRVQNQTGKDPRRWDKTGVIIEVRQFDQYAVKIHGSGRVTLRNRKFLRRYVPFSPSRCSKTSPQQSTPETRPTEENLHTCSPSRASPPSSINNTTPVSSDTTTSTFHTAPNTTPHADGTPTQLSNPAPATQAISTPISPMVLRPPTPLHSPPLSEEVELPITPVTHTGDNADAPDTTDDVSRGRPRRDRRMPPHLSDFVLK